MSEMIDYSTLLKNFSVLLKNNKLKFTKQRELVLKTLYDNSGHFSSEDIRQMINDKSGIKVGIATIYRTLTLLEDAGFADSISFGKDGKIYEIGMKNHHDHLICTECMHIIEFLDENIEKRQEEIAKRHDFKITGHTMKIVGLCKSCQEKQEKKSQIQESI